MTAPASFAFYNTKQDVDLLANAIEKVTEVFGVKLRGVFVGLSVIFSLSSCSSSPACESAGQKEFQRQHPNYTIVEIVPDGNETGVSYVAHFKKPKDEKIYFAYISGEDNKSHKCEVGVREF
jgi:hypothetical protein